MNIYMLMFSSFFHERLFSVWKDASQKQNFDVYVLTWSLCFINICLFKCSSHVYSLLVVFPTLFTSPSPLSLSRLSLSPHSLSLSRLSLSLSPHSLSLSLSLSLVCLYIYLKLKAVRWGDVKSVLFNSSNVNHHSDTHCKQLAVA